MAQKTREELRQYIDANIVENTTGDISASDINVLEHDEVDSFALIDEVGASNFLELSDTPTGYTGSGDFYVKVKSDETGLEFIEGSGIQVAWGDITGTLSNQTDLQNALDAKENSLGNPSTDGYVLSSTAAGVRSWVEMTGGGSGGDMYKSVYDTDDSGVVDNAEALGGNTPSYYASDANLTAHTSATDNPHNVTYSQTGADAAGSADAVQSNLDSHTADTGNPHSVTSSQVGAYSTSQYIDVSTGTPDAGKPIVLDINGRIDVSMLDTSTFYYVGPHDPSAGVEYPDTSSESAGAFWVVDTLSAPNDGDGYIFQAGELTGKRITVGDFMVWGSGGWGIMAGEMNPLLYYKLDGSQAITGAFAGGSQQIKNIADGTDDTDAVTIGQFNTKNASQDTNISTAQSTADTAQAEIDAHEARTDNPHSVTAAQVGADPTGSADAVQANLDTHVADIENPHAVTASQVGADPTGSAAAVQTNLDTHTSATDNPHAVTKAQVGLDFVINTGDGLQYLANDGTYKTVSGGGSGTLIGLTDTPSDYGSSGQVLITDGTSSTSWGTVGGALPPGTEGDLLVMGATDWESAGTVKYSDGTENLFTFNVSGDYSSIGADDTHVIFEGPSGGRMTWSGSWLEPSSSSYNIGSQSKPWGKVYSAIFALERTTVSNLMGAAQIYWDENKNMISVLADNAEYDNFDVVGVKDIYNLSEGDVLAWNATNGEWAPTTNINNNTTGTTSSVSSFWTGTQAEYDALGTYSDTTIYFIT